MNTDASQISDIAVSEQDHVLTLAFNRPAQRNAINYEMFDVLTARIVSASQGSDVRCIVLTGCDGIFSAGHDVHAFEQGLSMAVEDKPTFRFMHALLECVVPVVAAVNGDAVGIGATMLFHCDLVYAVPDARLSFPFMKMGLVPEFGSTNIIPRMIGQQRAMELFLLNGKATAKEAKSWGLVNALIEIDDLAQYAHDVALKIAALSPEAVRKTKWLAKQANAATLRSAICDEAHAFHELLATAHVKEQLAAIRTRISSKNAGA